MRSLCLILLSMAPAHAYLRSTTREGNPLRRTDSDNIRFRANRGVAPGAPDSDGRPMITADSDPLAALQSALSTWNGVESSAARFAPLQVTDAENSSSDGQPVIVFLDTAEARSIVGSALAVTRTFFFTDGRITDSDILFNPRITSGGARASFSTTLAEGTFDLQSVATHELGHALGAGHSGLIGATMFPSTPSAASFQSQLSTDDIAFVTDAYPSPSAASSFGTISGVVSMSGTGPLGGALVVAVEADSGVTVGALSS
ncbi:MAG: matrixin family metalloprotease [Bryobacterales bacterium]|nr:matrixin family metalloprotease [Bryobacterales bacterium]